jgi:hypothetical protein
VFDLGSPKFNAVADHQRCRDFEIYLFHWRVLSLFCWTIPANESLKVLKSTAPGGFKYNPNFR